MEPRLPVLGRWLLILRTNAIQWIVAPGILSATFFQDDIITEKIIGNFWITLTSRIPNGTGTSDLTSTLRVVTTTSQNGSMIQCVSGIGRVNHGSSELLQVNSAPSC